MRSFSFVINDNDNEANTSRKGKEETIIQFTATLFFKKFILQTISVNGSKYAVIPKDFSNKSDKKAPTGPIKLKVFFASESNLKNELSLTLKETRRIIRNNAKTVKDE